MRTFEDETFERFRDRGGSTFSDVTFRRCELVSSSVSITKDPAKRSTVRDVVLEDCSVVGCSLRCAVVEDVVIDGLRTSDLHQAWGAVFRHVVLRGRVGRLMLSPLVTPLEPESAVQRSFNEANSAYYEGVDWALDISAVEASELDIRGIPARLVRRDPETQAVVSRAAALAGKWRELDRVADCWFSGAIEGMLMDGEPDVVLVAGRRDREFRKLMGAIEPLRSAGIAEPD